MPSLSDLPYRNVQEVAEAIYYLSRGDSDQRFPEQQAPFEAHKHSHPPHHTRPHPPPHIPNTMSPAAVPVTVAESLKDGKIITGLNLVPGSQSRQYHSKIEVSRCEPWIVFHPLTNYSLSTPSPPMARSTTAWNSSTA